MPVGQGSLGIGIQWVKSSSRTAMFISSLRLIRFDAIRQPGLRPRPQKVTSGKLSHRRIARKVSPFFGAVLIGCHVIVFSVFMFILYNNLLTRESQGQTENTLLFDIVVTFVEIGMRPWGTRIIRIP